jgi:hypothetical protein
MLRRNSLWSAVIRLISAMYSSQITKGSNPAVVRHPSKAAVPGAQISGWRGWLRPYREVRLLLMAVLVLTCGSAWAQTTGTLLGVVSDQSGAAVSSATVRATNTDTGFVTTFLSISHFLFGATRGSAVHRQHAPYRMCRHLYDLPF